MCSKSQPFKAACVISRLKLSFETLLVNEKRKIVNALHHVVHLWFSVLWETIEPGACSPCCAATKAGRQVLAEWESWRERVQITSWSIESQDEEGWKSCLTTSATDVIENHQWRWQGVMEDKKDRASGVLDKRQWQKLSTGDPGIFRKFSMYLQSSLGTTPLLCIKCAKPVR